MGAVVPRLLWSWAFYDPRSERPRTVVGVGAIVPRLLLSQVPYGFRTTTPGTPTAQEWKIKETVQLRSLHQGRPSLCKEDQRATDLQPGPRQAELDLPPSQVNHRRKTSLSLRMQSTASLNLLPGPYLGGEGQSGGPRTKASTATPLTTSASSKE